MLLGRMVQQQVAKPHTFLFVHKSIVPGNIQFKETVSGSKKCLHEDRFSCLGSETPRKEGLMYQPTANRSSSD